MKTNDDESYNQFKKLGKGDSEISDSFLRKLHNKITTEIVNKKEGKKKRTVQLKPQKGPTCGKEIKSEIGLYSHLKKCDPSKLPAKKAKVIEEAQIELEPKIPEVKKIEVKPNIA